MSCYIRREKSVPLCAKGNDLTLWSYNSLYLFSFIFFLESLLELVFRD
jgi:hypothetical protein